MCCVIGGDRRYLIAIEDVRSRPTGRVPIHLRDSHYYGAKRIIQASTTSTPRRPAGLVKQDYLPEELAGNEVEIADRQSSHDEAS